VTLLHPGELANTRVAFGQLLTSQAVIARVTRERDAGGGWTTVTTDVATLPCSYFQFMITPREQETTTTVRAISFWTFLFPAGSDVRPTDKIKVGARTWEVVGGGERTVELRLSITAMEIK
jgi:hypothetical protein